MNKYSQNYTVAQKEESPFMAFIGALGMFALIIFAMWDCKSP